MKKTLFTIITFILSISYSYSASLYDPALEWNTIVTAHFRIHYHRGLKNTAHDMSAIAEKVHEELARDIGWIPRTRTDVILVDNRDLANGQASPFPVNRIEIIVSRPALDSILNNSIDSLEMVFRHEYTHILNMDTIGGCPSLTRYFPGRVWFPAIFQPIWQIEGNAVLHESRGTGMGRNNSNLTRMILRTEVESGNLKPISKSSVFPREWPMGRVPYLYGGLFVEYLENKYGRGSMAKVFQENADNVIPYLINKNAKDIYGRSFIDLWAEWEKYTIKKYTNEIIDIKKDGISKTFHISNPHNDSRFPRFSRDGRKLYYITRSSKKGYALVKYNFSDKKNKKLCRVFYPGSLSITSDSTLSVSYTHLRAHET